MTDTMSAQDTGIDAEGAEPVAEGTEPVEGAEAGAGRGRASVKYLGQEGFTAEILDTLPEQTAAVRQHTASHLYYKMLEAVAADEEGLGKWHKIAEFGTVNGAQGIATTLNKQVAGKVGTGRGMVKPNEVRALPEYDGWHFEFAGVKVPKPGTDPASGERVSHLYARMVENEVVVDDVPPSNEGDPAEGDDQDVIAV